jgi:hypothetical protein
LVNVDPPQESVRVLGDELTTAAIDGRLTYYLDQPVRLDAVTATAPHAFFVMDADAIMDDDPAAYYSGWRYLIEINRRPVAIANTVVDLDGNHSYGGIGTGPAVSAVVYAVHVADELLRDTSAEFMIAAIEVPALHIVLLQVTATDGADMAFLPIGLATSLHPARFYSRTQIRQELRQMAARIEAEPFRGEPVGG